MLGALANTATEMVTTKNVSYILSIGQLYAAVLLFSANQSHDDHIEIKFNTNYWPNTSENFGYFAEFLDQTRTNPYSVWTKYNRPAYPNETVLMEMMHAQV